jgi:hypothetical protein
MKKKISAHGENYPHIALSKGKCIVAQKSEIKNKIKTYDFQENFLPLSNKQKYRRMAILKGEKCSTPYAFKIRINI